MEAKDLKIGSKIYSCYCNNVEYKHHEIHRLNAVGSDCIEIHVGHWDKFTVNYKCKSWKVGDCVYFINEPDAVRYSKAQTMKVLHRLLDNARSSINAVKKFRSDNYENLNHKFLDAEIRKLEQTQL